MKGDDTFKPETRGESKQELTWKDRTLPFGKEPCLCRLDDQSIPEVWRLFAGKPCFHPLLDAIYLSFVPQMIATNQTLTSLLL